MSTKQKIVVGLVFVIAGITVQFRSRSSRELPANTAPLELKGSPIQTTEKTVPEPASPVAAASDKVVPSVTRNSEPVVTAAAAKTATPATPPDPGPAVVKVEAVGQAPDKNGFTAIGFEKLATFNYVVPEDAPTGAAPVVKAKEPDQIPALVRALDQKLISLKGYMLPLKVEAGLVTELLIMKDQSMCCFGSVPKINEWVSVKMSGHGVKAVMDQPVTLFGKLFVGEIRENGYLVGIYRMEGERLEGPSDN